MVLYFHQIHSHQVQYLFYYHTQDFFFLLHLFVIHNNKKMYDAFLSSLYHCHRDFSAFSCLCLSVNIRSTLQLFAVSPALFTQLQHGLHHFADSIKHLVDRCLAHEGRCCHHLVLRVHVHLLQIVKETKGSFA